MRFRLLRRRLTISAPKMAIRSTLPWPLRWVLVAIVLGFCAAIGMWAFDFGREIAGLDRLSKDELPRLRSEVDRLTSERDKAQSVANTAGSLLATAQATQERLTAQIKQLEAESHVLRDDLGFFEKLLPVTGNGGVAIRGLQAEVLAGVPRLAGVTRRAPGCAVLHKTSCCRPEPALERRPVWMEGES